MTEPHRLVFLIDIDNTLLDNDRLKVDVDVKLDGLLGIEQSRRFWELYEAVRHEMDVVDIPETVRRFKEGYSDAERYEMLQKLFDEIDFSSYLYPDVIETLKHLDSIGLPIILTDGDKVFQKAKAEKSGLAAAVDNRVLIYVHKQRHFAEIMERYPALRYVMIEDKDRILNDAAALLGDKLITVFVCQGKYALDPKLRADPEPDLTVMHIADLREYSVEEFLTRQFHPPSVPCPTAEPTKTISK